MFHMLGYRRVRKESARITFERQSTTEHAAE
jgi:hypothetical protein